MNQKLLFALWGSMFILCAALGFIPEPEGVLRILMITASVVFFLPPFWMLHRAGAEEDTHAVTLIRNLSAISLGLTVVLLVLNFLSAMSSEALGTILYYVLVIVSSPMICSGYWVLSLFLWACLLTVSRKMLKKK